MADGRIESSLPGLRNVSSGRPSNKIWSVYVSEAERQDRTLALSWKGDMDALLIFAGLFSATITAFIIESYKTLTPDSADATVALLTQISFQISALANGTQISFPPPSPPPHRPTSHALLCNAFWFLSLAFSLTCALAATLVDQWARNYLNANDAHPSPHKRARIRAYLYAGLRRFRMKTIVEAIPTLLHISLVLFFVGLIEFLFPINTIIRNLTIVILVVCTSMYVIITFLPLFYHDCPYQTPFSALCWRIMEVVYLYVYPRWNEQTKGHVGMLQARELAATSWSKARDKRDGDALSWTLQSLAGSMEIEPFVEGIVGFVSELGTTNFVLIRQLLEDPNIKLGTHVVWLLSQAGYQEGPEKVRRTVVCLTAMWSLLENCCDPTAHVEKWFDEETLPILEMLKYDGPIIGHYLSSTMTIYLIRLLDSFSDFASNAERTLGRLGMEGPWATAEPWIEQTQTQKYLNDNLPQLSTGCMVSFKAWMKRIERSIPTTPNNDKDTRSKLATVTHSTFVDMADLGPSLRSFQAALYEARLTLFNDYVAEITSDQPPFETWNTFYDITIDPTIPSHPVSLYNQTRLVGSLEWTSQLPRLAVDHLLNLVNILDEPELTKKARALVNNYLAVCPDSAAAVRALAILQANEAPSAEPVPETTLSSESTKHSP